MKIKINTPPASEPMTLNLAKQHLRVTGTDDDVIITSVIKQAREYCEAYLNRKLITQTLEGYLDEFPSDEIEFSNSSPVKSITSIIYTDSNGNVTTIDSNNYVLDNISFVNKVLPVYGASWPSVTLQPVNGIKITFVSGADSVAENIVWAMVLHMKTLYDDLAPDEMLKTQRARDALLALERVIPA